MKLNVWFQAKYSHYRKPLKDANFLYVYFSVYMCMFISYVDTLEKADVPKPSRVRERPKINNTAVVY